jgi:hypothetical protein
MHLFLIALLAVMALPLKASSDSSLIRTMCMAAFSSAMSQAGKIPPAGMGESTCDCFQNQLDEGAALDVAQAYCKQEAAEAFSQHSN